MSQSDRPLRRHSSSSVHSVSEKKESSSTRQPIEPVNLEVAVKVKKGRRRVHSNSLDVDNAHKRRHSVSSQSSAGDSHRRGNSRSRSPAQKNSRVAVSSVVTGVRAALRSNSNASLIDGLPYILPRKTVADTQHKGAPVKPHQSSSKSDTASSHSHHKAGKAKRSSVGTSESRSTAGPSRGQRKGRKGSKRDHKAHRGKRTGSVSEHSKRKKTTGSCASSRWVLSPLTSLNVIYHTWYVQIHLNRYIP